MDNVLTLCEVVKRNRIFGETPGTSRTQRQNSPRTNQNLLFFHASSSFDNQSPFITQQLFIPYNVPDYCIEQLRLTITSYSIILPLHLHPIPARNTPIPNWTEWLPRSTSYSTNAVAFPLPADNQLGFGLPLPFSIRSTPLHYTAV